MNPSENSGQQNFGTQPQVQPPVQGTGNTYYQDPSAYAAANQYPNQQNAFTPPPTQMVPGANPNMQAAAPLTASRPAINPNSTQNHLQIAEIRDGIVIMNDGSFRSVIMVQSINFDLMSPQEREGVEYGYQGFLNSLYFPIQIFIRSQKVDLAPYIQKLDKIRSEHDNMLLAMLMDDYINFIDQLAAQTNIMDKHFYIAIPFFPRQDLQQPIASSKGLLSGAFKMFGNTSTHVVINENELEAAKTELRNRVQACMAGLQQCGIQGLPLDTQELIELYYDIYNPDTATRQKLANFNDLTVPVVTKGQGQAPQPNLDKEMY